MTDYSLLQIKNAAEKLEEDGVHLVSLRDLKNQLCKQEFVSSIVSTLNMISKYKEYKDYPHSTREQVILEHIPRICLGRRQGHTSAIVEFIQNTMQNIVVVVPTVFQLTEFAYLLNIRTPLYGSSLIEYKPNVSVMTQSYFKSHQEYYSRKLPLVIFDQEALSTKFLMTNSDIDLRDRIVLVGN